MDCFQHRPPFLETGSDEVDLSVVLAADLDQVVALEDLEVVADRGIIEMHTLSVKPGFSLPPIPGNGIGENLRSDDSRARVRLLNRSPSIRRWRWPIHPKRSGAKRRRGPRGSLTDNR